MELKEARKLASKAAIWYHQNNIGRNANQRVAGQPKKSPKFSDDVWARLMAEAVLSFHDGLEDRIDPRDRTAMKALFDRANDFVGQEAFQVIAMVVSAAGAQRPMEEEVETALDQMQQSPGQQSSFLDPNSFLPAVDLSGYLTNDADNQAYGKFSSWLMQMSGQPITQGAMHQATKYLQDLAKTPGLSQGFAYVLSSMGTEYQMLADKYTRESGQGQFQGGGDLPTGIQIQGKKATVADFVIEAYRRVAEQMGIS